MGGSKESLQEGFVEELVPSPRRSQQHFSGSDSMNSSSSKRWVWIPRVDLSLSSSSTDSIVSPVSASTDIQPEKERQLLQRQPGQRTGKDPLTSGLLRAALFVCMTPASKASPAIISARRAAVERSVSTTHWPHKFVATHTYSAFEAVPADRRVRFRVPPPPRLSATQRALVDGNGKA